jgi:hypothetical protein
VSFRATMADPCGAAGRRTGDGEWVAWLQVRAAPSQQPCEPTCSVWRLSGHSSPNVVRCTTALYVVATGAEQGALQRGEPREGRRTAHAVGTFKAAADHHDLWSCWNPKRRVHFTASAMFWAVTRRLGGALLLGHEPGLRSGADENVSLRPLLAQEILLPPTVPNPPPRSGDATGE